MNLEAFQAAYEKVEAAVDRLKTLNSSGAVKKDIDDQKAVVAEVIEQFKEVAGIDAMPATDAPKAA